MTAKIAHIHRADESEEVRRPLHHRRPIATVGVGLAIFFAILALAVVTNFAGDKKTATAPITIYTPPQAPAPSTADWATYSDTQYPISFKYPPSWRVDHKTSGSDYLITIKPEADAATSKISIFISKDGFLGFEGLTEETTTIAGKPAVKIDNSLAGLKVNDEYYTFDAGLAATNVPIFDALLGTLQFK